MIASLRKEVFSNKYQSSLLFKVEEIDFEKVAQFFFFELEAILIMPKQVKAREGSLKEVFSFFHNESIDEQYKRFLSQVHEKPLQRLLVLKDKKFYQALKDEDFDQIILLLEENYKEESSLISLISRIGDVFVFGFRRDLMSKLLSLREYFIELIETDSFSPFHEKEKALKLKKILSLMREKNEISNFLVDSIVESAYKKLRRSEKNSDTEKFVFFNLFRDFEDFRSFLSQLRKKVVSEAERSEIELSSAEVSDFLTGSYLNSFSKILIDRLDREEKAFFSQTLDTVKKGFADDYDEKAFLALKSEFFSLSERMKFYSLFVREGRSRRRIVF